MRTIGTNYYTTNKHNNHTLERSEKTCTSTTSYKNKLKNSQEMTRMDQDQNPKQKQKATQKSPIPTYRSATHQLLETIASSVPHQESPQTPIQQSTSLTECQEIQKTVALLLLHRNNRPHTQWPQPSAPSQLPPPTPQLSPVLELEEDQEVEQGIAALWEEVLLAPLHSESVMHWPWHFDDLEAEEVKVILRLEAEVAEAHQEVEEAQQRILHRYLLPQW